MADNTYFYCFTIRTQSDENFYLTSLPNSYSYHGTTFIPNSGLVLYKHDQDDAAQNVAIIKGIYEDGGIVKEQRLMDGNVTVTSFFEGKQNSSFTYIIRRIVHNDLDFELHLEPESFKYSANATKQFSRTCRASFCDTNCGLDATNYTKEYDVQQCSGNELKIEGLPVDTGYYKGGKAILYSRKGHIFTTSISSQYRNTIRLMTTPPKDFMNIKKIKLRAGCDKKFISCCKKFHNALNFRGEPFIPEFKVLEN